MVLPERFFACRKTFGFKFFSAAVEAGCASSEQSLQANVLERSRARKQFRFSALEAVRLRLFVLSSVMSCAQGDSRGCLVELEDLFFVCVMERSSSHWSAKSMMVVMD